jgi:APA family basic amino acid/polyamine antiporter
VIDNAGRRDEGCIGDLTVLEARAAGLAGIVVLSAAASGLALLLMAPRVYVAMSRDGLFPETVAAPSPSTGAPTRATALLAAISSVYVLTGTFEQILALFLCPALAFVALAAAGIFRLRRQAGASSGFRCPGHPVTPALFIALLLAVAGLVAIRHPLPVLAGCALVALGLPVHRLFSARRNRSRGSRSA